MVNLIKNEVYKIFKQKKLYIFMGITLVLSLLQYIGILLIRNVKINDEITSSLVNINGQTMPMMMLGGISTVIVIYITILLADIVTDEYKNGTLKLSLLRPITRIKLLISKVAGLFIGIVALLAFTLVTSYVFGTAFFGWGEKFIFSTANLSSTGDIINVTATFSAVNGILFTLASYLLAIIPYMAFGMLVFFVSLLFSNMGATIGTSLGAWFVFSLVSQLIKQARPFIINTYYTFYMNFAQKPDIKQVVIGSIVILLYGIVFFTASVFVFRKKDILL